MKIRFVLSLLIALAGTPAVAQTPQTANMQRNLPEVAAEYTFVHANAPPAECGCFSMNGGSISIAQPFRSGQFSFAFDTTISHASGISPAKYDLTLSAFTAGVRYRPMPRARWNAFAEVLVGAAHASGSLVSGNTPAAADSALVFASTIGGGLDRKLSGHWALRVVEFDYLLTTYTNLVNDHQNNIRVSTGVAYHF